MEIVSSMQPEDDDLDSSNNPESSPVQSKRSLFPMNSFLESKDGSITHANLIQISFFISNLRNVGEINLF